MRRIGILTAGGDTPALNATIHGAVVRANQLRVEVFGFIKGFNSLFNPRVPHVHLNPLYQEIPELDPTKGGTLIGSSRDFVDPERTEDLDLVDVAARAARHRGAHLRRRRRHAERPAAARRAPADGARAEDDRQRPRPQLPERAGRVGPRADAATKRATLQAHPVERGRSTWTSIVNYVTPGLRDRGLRLRHRRRAHPHHRREPPPHRDHRGDGPALRATSRSAPRTASPTSSSCPSMPLDVELPRASA